MATGASCNINITFTPTGIGSRTASLSLSDDAIPGSQSVPLTGTGVAPVAMLSGTSVGLGSQLVGTGSAPKTVTLTNTGNAPLTLSISVTGTNKGDFLEPDNCGGAVIAGSNCTITLSFEPTGTGPRTASVTISDNVPGNPQQTVSLTGTGIGTQGDFDGDHKADLGVWRSSNGTWYIIPSSAPTTFTVTQWGITGDIPVPGGYDGDGKTDMAVWRPSIGTWFVIPSSAPTTFTKTQWGISTDMPVQKPIGQ